MMKWLIFGLVMMSVFMTACSEQPQKLQTCEQVCDACNMSFNHSQGPVCGCNNEAGALVFTGRGDGNTPVCEVSQ